MTELGEIEDGKRVPPPSVLPPQAIGQSKGSTQARKHDQGKFLIRVEFHFRHMPCALLNSFSFRSFTELKNQLKKLGLDVTGSTQEMERRLRDANDPNRLSDKSENWTITECQLNQAEGTIKFFIEDKTPPIGGKEWISFQNAWADIPNEVTSFLNTHQECQGLFFHDIPIPEDEENQNDFWLCLRDIRKKIIGDAHLEIKRFVSEDKKTCCMFSIACPARNINDCLLSVSDVFAAVPNVVIDYASHNPVSCAMIQLTLQSGPMKNFFAKHHAKHYSKHMQQLKKRVDDYKAKCNGGMPCSSHSRNAEDDEFVLASDGVSDLLHGDNGSHIMDTTFDTVSLDLFIKILH